MILEIREKVTNAVAFFCLRLTISSVLVLTMSSGFAQAEARIMFYNVENLFDTIDNPVTADDEFTPNSEKAYGTKRFATKLGNLSRVISEAGEMPQVIGLCEVENKQVVEALLSTKPLSKAGYKIVHYESPDGRGIDNALIYRKPFKLIESKAISVALGEGERPTRDLLYVKLKYKRDVLHLVVVHWPSRYGGQEASEPKRVIASEALEGFLIRNKLTSDKVIVMGDFNDYPNNHSITRLTNCETAFCLVNLADSLHHIGQGSYNYKGQWGMLDQMLVTPRMITGKNGFTAKAADFSVLRKDWMMYTNKKTGDQSPNRTYGGNNFYGGYSDHLPVILELNYFR